MTRAFISYSHADQVFAGRLAKALEAVSIEPWIDREGIHGGARWSSSIQQALDEADALILILSPAAMASSNVEDEWQYALDEGTPVVPVLWQPTKVHFQLGRIQHLDFHDQPFDAAMVQLAAALRHVVEEPIGKIEPERTGVGSARGGHGAKPPAIPSRLPTGTVTFLFTDIEGSTQRWEHHPAAMRPALERHDLLLRGAVAEAGGHVFKTVGDAFCAAFARAGDALAAAVAAQRAVAEEDWPAYGKDFQPLAIRAALHTGEAVERDGDYFGPPVNRVARLEAAAHGGQILLSASTHLVVRAALPEGFGLHDWGEHRLKDLRHSEHIYQLRGPGLPAVPIPPVTAEALHPRERVRVATANPARDEEEPNATEARSASAADSPWACLEKAVTGDGDEAVTLTPEEARSLARHKPADWREWRLGRIAEWSQPRYRLDGRFVGLTLLIDQGEEMIHGRWAAKDEPFSELSDLLRQTDDPALVLLGPPGSGKSTLLRRLELDTAIAGLRAATSSAGDGAEQRDRRHRDPDSERITFFVALNTYRAAHPGEAPLAPSAWLDEQWSLRAPGLPPLDELLAAGRVTLLLDALNEIPADSEADFQAHVRRWKDWLQHLVAQRPGNRVVLSCRSLDYSQPLSTPELRVPQVKVEALSDDQVRDFLELYSPARWREIWATLKGSPQLDVLRSPYFLALLVQQVESSGQMPSGRAALFTGFVRQALRREVQRGNALFDPGELLASRDLRQIVKWRWKGAYDLPERGVLMSKLAALAHAMQETRADGERSQVRVDLDDALDLLDTEADEEIVTAGAALAVLDEDEAAGELMYIHQLVQEYFAARALARRPEPELVRVAWRAAEIRPTVGEVLDRLDPADPLPGLPQTGWEETTLLAAAMAPDPGAFLQQLMETNLVLAARAAAQPDLRERLPADMLDSLRQALVERSRDREADLRVRIAAADELGDLGDPRFERRTGPDGEYLFPALIEIPGGSYPIGGDEPIHWSMPGASGVSKAHMPRHEVSVAPFSIGRFPVTNVEWAAFIAAGAYEEERWWCTEDARRWRRGELPNEGAKSNSRMWRERFLADPEFFEQMAEQGGFPSSEDEERWREWLAMEAQGFEAALDAHWRIQRHTEPSFWRNADFNRPTQPVVGVCWYEARAYCAWLSAQTGLEVRLPTEVEWEAAAGGEEGRPYPWGSQEELTRANAYEARLKRTSPVGAFAAGDTPLGVSDLGGNVYEWTTSLFGGPETEAPEDTSHPYPYRADDGREDVEAPPVASRVARGGAWGAALASARVTYRDGGMADYRNFYLGFRVVVDHHR